MTYTLELSVRAILERTDIYVGQCLGVTNMLTSSNGLVVFQVSVPEVSVATTDIGLSCHWTQHGHLSWELLCLLCQMRRAEESGFLN